ncbi:MAG: ribulose-phosphate 3-epimerase [Saprospiraceae bacterium]|nr:ribulose-phosphate 3-epimerase [Saprospiraceae bacterium]
MREVILAPSLLASDFGRLAEEIEMINGSEADYFHVDVMDGRFVPNISFGQPIIKHISKWAKKPLDVHLMILEPEKYIEEFRSLGAEIITVHVEACPHLHRTVHQIKESGAKAGVALNPHTPISIVENLLEDADLFLIMSVNPGFGGQKFIYNSLLKIKALKTMLIEVNSNALIEIDGGVGLQNAEAIIKAGTDILVAGTSVFGAKDPLAAVKAFKSIPADISIL